MLPEPIRVTPPPAFGTPIRRHELAKRVVLAGLQEGHLAIEFQVLRLGSDRGVRKHARVGAQSSAIVHNRERTNLRSVADSCGRMNDRIWPELDADAELRSLVYDSCRMALYLHAHRATPVPGSTINDNKMASAAVSPSTVARPAILHARGRIESTVSSIRS